MKLHFFSFSKFIKNNVNDTKKITPITSIKNLGNVPTSA